MSEYIIKVTRLGLGRVTEGIHYYNGDTGRENSYSIMHSVENADTFTEQETKKIVKKIELIYKKFSYLNGKLLKIEVLDAETLKLVNMCESEPEEIISRFELMEL